MRNPIATKFSSQQWSLFLHARPGSRDTETFKGQAGLTTRSCLLPGQLAWPVALKQQRGWSPTCLAVPSSGIFFVREDRQLAGYRQNTCPPSFLLPPAPICLCTYELFQKITRETSWNQDLAIQKTLSWIWSDQHDAWPWVQKHPKPTRKKGIMTSG